MNEAILDVRHGRSCARRRHPAPGRRPAQAALGRAVAAALALAGPAASAREQATGSPADQIEAALLTGESATAILGRWCADHRLADPPRIVARRDPGADQPAPASVRRALRARRGEPIAYRRVDLACGERVLSAADNWYLPDHLTAAMEKTLETTTTPFGQVVAPLGFHRLTLRAERPRRPAPGAPILRITAVLVAVDGRPFSVVRESYLPALAP